LITNERGKVIGLGEKQKIWWTPLGINIYDNQPMKWTGYCPLTTIGDYLDVWGLHRENQVYHIDKINQGRIKAPTW